MGTARIENTSLWVRCWEGTEMEYENFNIEKDIIPMLKLDDQQIANKLGAVKDNQFVKAMNRIREIASWEKIFIEEFASWEDADAARKEQENYKDRYFLIEHDEPDDVYLVYERLDN